MRGKEGEEVRGKEGRAGREVQISSRGCELLAQHSRNGTGHTKQTPKDTPLVGSGSRGGGGGGGERKGLRCGKT